MRFYQLMHFMPEASVKDLGLYTSLAEVRRAQAHLNRQPGFCDNPDGYLILEHSVPKLRPGALVYQAQVYSHTEDYGAEFCSELGFFKDLSDAQKALEEVKAINGEEFPGLVRELIESWREFNRIDWAEGYDYDPPKQ